MYDYILGFIGGFCIYSVFKNAQILYKNYKLNKAQKDLQKAVVELNKNDPISIDFNRRKQQIAYSNKVKQVESKINDLKRSRLPEQIAEIMTGQIIVQIADIMVEADRRNGKLDDLYSEK